MIALSSSFANQLVRFRALWVWNRAEGARSDVSATDEAARRFSVSLGKLARSSMGIPFSSGRMGGQLELGVLTMFGQSYV